MKAKQYVVKWSSDNKDFELLFTNKQKAQKEYKRHTNNVFLLEYNIKTGLEIILKYML